MSSQFCLNPGSMSPKIPTISKVRASVQDESWRTPALQGSHWSAELTKCKGPSAGRDPTGSNFRKDTTRYINSFRSLPHNSSQHPTSTTFIHSFIHSFIQSFNQSPIPPTPTLIKPHPSHSLPQPQQKCSPKPSSPSSASPATPAPSPSPPRSSFAKTPSATLRKRVPRVRSRRISACTPAR